MKAWTEDKPEGAKDYDGDAKDAAETCAIENYPTLKEDVITVYVQDGDRARRFDVEVGLSAEAFEIGRR